MKRRAWQGIGAAFLITVAVSCGSPSSMMGPGGHMSGGDMMARMREPGVMDDWMDEVSRDPEMMGRMMRGMHERMGSPDAVGEAPVYCPMMGFTPDHPPSPEPPYTPGSLSGAELYQVKCSRCHALPSPSLHTPEEWSGTIERMAGYIAAVQFVSLSEEERAATLSYLRERAAR